MEEIIKSCYIHIPFCKNICSYCDFCKLLYSEKFVNQYLSALKEEISTIYQNDVLDTIYIGGGTPSCLSLEQLKSLFTIINQFQVSNHLEFTVECNFDSVTEEKLLLFKEYGVNRLSFGLESTHSDILKLLNRKEEKDKVLATIQMCRRLGFSNINIDLMYAIPGEDLSILKSDLDFILSLDIEHISTYSLMIEEHTKLFIKGIKYIDEDLDYQMYQLICDKLKDKYLHYEISNFSKEGYQSKHNRCYWKNKNYYGFGLGASSYIGNRRINNTRSFQKYIKDKYVLDYEILNKSDIMNYEMILGLRLMEGVNKEEFFKKYHKDIYEVFKLDELISKKLLCDNGNIYIPENNWYISNEILVNLIKE